MTLSNRTFGVEIELKGLNTSQAKQAIAATGIDVETTDYTHRTTSYWKVLTDGSLTGTSCEVVSPVLKGESGIKEVRKVAKALATAGARVDRECGLHVHVGTNDLTPNDVAMVLSRYARFESEIDSFMPRSRRSDNAVYCRSIVSSVRNRINGQLFGSIDNVARSMGGERYLKINMQAYSRHRTIEFRQHSGTCNASKIENWIRFVLAFVEASKGQQAQSASRAAGRARPASGYQRTQTNGRRINSMDDKFDNIIRAFRNEETHSLSIAEIARFGGWSEASVAPYITRLRQERGCVIRKNRATGKYVLVGNSGRLSNNTTVAVQTQRAARRVRQSQQPRTIGNISGDSLFRSVPNDVKSFYEERMAEFSGSM